MTIKQGETYPAFSTTLLDSAGAAVNLAGATVKFRMANAASGVNVINDATMTITDAAGGKVSYAWQTADVATAGVFIAEIWSDIAGYKTPYPNNDYIVIEILPSVAKGA